MNAVTDDGDDEEKGYWEARYHVEREKRRLECDDCGRRLMFDGGRVPTRPTLRQSTIPFRCRVCCRVYCRECALDHFDLGEDDVWA